MGRRKEPITSRNEKILKIAGLLEKGLSYEQIRQQLGVGKDRIGAVRKVLISNQMTAKDLCEMDDNRLDQLFDNTKSTSAKKRASIFDEPDLEYYSKELMKPGVTRQLLWEEYRDDCYRRNTIPYQLTQFKVKLNKYIDARPYAQLIIHKPGCLIEVDWTGDKAHWFDPETGESVYGWLFVGVLSFSGLTYAEVFPDMSEPVWIKAHTNMFQYFKGVTPTLRCDNLKTGIVKHPKNGMYVLQKDYKALAAYYGIVVVPGDPNRPKSKPHAENSVKNCEERLLAALRNEKCYSIEEYNHKLAEKLEAFNNKPFQQRSGSRRSVYTEYEKDTLCPLPDNEYEYCDQSTAKLRTDGFISFEKNFYSVPKKKPGDTVNIYAYNDRVEIFDGLEQLAVHKRARKGSWKKVYDPSHFSNTGYGEWNKDRFLRWAEQIGPNTYTVVKGMFDSGPEQVYYSKAHSLLKLADKYPIYRLENACALALKHVQRPSYRTVKSILSNDQDLREFVSEKPETKPHRREYSYLGEAYAENRNR